MGERVNPSAAETRIFQVNSINTMAADALAPSVSRSSATVVLIVWLWWIEKKPLPLPRDDFSNLHNLSVAKW